MDPIAAWVADHALMLFLTLPALSAAAALAIWRLAAALPAGRRRIALYAGLACGMAVLFTGLALSVRGQGGLVMFDMLLARHLGASVAPRALWALSWFTHLGDRDFLTVVAVGMTSLLLLRRQWLLGAGCVAATLGGGLLNLFLKSAFQRERPVFEHEYAAVSGWSFPSGHASAAMAVYGMACYLLLRVLPTPWRPACVAGAAALIMGIGISRVLLQVHYASDVVAGFAVTALWLALCVAVVERRLGPARG
ncbi:membrane-associated phosphatase [Bordetella ansorpii]|uniref:Membrane-associated phosphatase n=1 Tax=Bordetella ansorpii TaxID=288768 RepID=A0A157STH6_9BORD|nr:phosphatase PAP2 family protein [Bordetella ansorpii]SAI73770.1 membrane-associated phosphatase [Bordetella ansorpii]